MNTHHSILLVIPSLAAGGAERAISELAAEFARRGWTVTLATVADDPLTPDFYPLSPAVERVRLRQSPAARHPIARLAANRQRVQALRACVRARRPDLMLSFLDSTNVLALLATLGSSTPVVVCERTDPSMNMGLPRPWRLARRLLYRRAAAVVAQTDATARWLARHCGCAPVVIPNALRTLPEPSGARESLVLAVGRLSAEKGFDVLLRAFAGVAPTRLAWSLAIVGDGALRADLQAQAEALGIAGRVQWPGRQVEIEHWYARAGIVAQPSRFEGFPNVLLEAMGMGAAVVSSDCRSGPSDLISSGTDGLLVPVDDADALAAALAALMDDAALRDRLGHAASAVRVRYAAAKVWDRWEQLARQAIGRVPVAGAHRAPISP
ncbi:MAG: glycosyltransferase [Rubrivivax sp.]